MVLPEARVDSDVGGDRRRLTVNHDCQLRMPVDGPAGRDVRIGDDDTSEYEGTAKIMTNTGRGMWNPGVDMLRFSRIIRRSSAEMAREGFCLGCTFATWRSRFSSLTDA